MSSEERDNWNQNQRADFGSAAGDEAADVPIVPGKEGESETLSNPESAGPSDSTGNADR